MKAGDATSLTAPPNQEFVGAAASSVRNPLLAGLAEECQSAVETIDKVRGRFGGRSAPWTAAQAGSWAADFCVFGKALSTI